MFDIGFSEVLLIFVIALVVLGPEKLPRLASQVGRWIGRARAMARQFREQLEEEVNLEQVRRAHETKPQKPTESEPTPGAGATTAGAAGAGAAADPPASSAAGADGGAGSSHGADGQSQPPPYTTQPHDLGGAAYRGPDPADFRADTFSHAHPTDEYGANPLTPNGAAPPELRPSTMQPTATATSVADASTPSEANVAAAQAEPSAATPTQRVHGTEAYASNTPPAAPAPIEEADVHAKS
jgi:sec-independent protein translocase protein TatB